MNTKELLNHIRFANKKGEVFSTVRGNRMFIEDSNGEEVEVFGKKLDISSAEDDDFYYFSLIPDTDFYKEFHKQLALREKWYRVLPQRVSELFEGETLHYIHVDPLKLRISMSEVMLPETRSLFSHGSNTRFDNSKSPFDNNARFHLLKRNTPGRKKNSEFIQILNEENLRGTLPIEGLVDIHSRYGISSFHNLLHGSEVLFRLLRDGTIIGKVPRRDLGVSAEPYIELMEKFKFATLSGYAVHSVVTKHEKL